LKRSTRAFLFTGLSGTGKTMAAEVIARISARHSLHISGVRLVSTPLGQFLTRLFGGLAPDFRITSVERNFKK